MITSCSNAFPSMATKPNRVRSILGFILHLTTPGHVRQVSPPWPAAYAAPPPCALAPNRDRPAGHSRPRRSADQPPGPAAGPRLSSPGPSTWKARLGRGPRPQAPGHGSTTAAGPWPSADPPPPTAAQAAPPAARPPSPRSVVGDRPADQGSASAHTTSPPTLGATPDRLHHEALPAPAHPDLVGHEPTKRHPGIAEQADEPPRDHGLANPGRPSSSTLSGSALPIRASSPATIAPQRERPASMSKESACLAGPQAHAGPAPDLPQPRTAVGPGGKRSDRPSVGPGFVSGQGVYVGLCAVAWTAGIGGSHGHGPSDDR